MRPPKSFVWFDLFVAFVFISPRVRLRGGPVFVAGDGKASVRRRQALQLLIPVLDENEIA